MLLPKLLCCQAETKDALLHAINEEYVEAVEVSCDWLILPQYWPVIGWSYHNTGLWLVDTAWGELWLVQVLLDHEETIHVEGEPWSWETLSEEEAVFSTDMTPLVLAAHTNNYEIIKERVT